MCWPTKFIAALWMSSLARQHPHLRFITVSPGGTTGTAAADNMAGVMGLMMKHVAFPVVKVFGMAHGACIAARAGRARSPCPVSFARVGNFAVNRGFPPAFR